MLGSVRSFFYVGSLQIYTTVILCLSFTCVISNLRLPTKPYKRVIEQTREAQQDERTQIRNAVFSDNFIEFVGIFRWSLFSKSTRRGMIGFIKILGKGRGRLKLTILS